MELGECVSARFHADQEQPSSLSEGTRLRELSERLGSSLISGH